MCTEYSRSCSNRRLRIVITLAGDATEFDQLALLVLKLDALGDDLETERIAERDDRARKFSPVLDATQPLDE